MRLSLTKFTEPISFNSETKIVKKPRSRLKNKNSVTYISNSLKVRKQEPVSDISQILLTTRRNFMDLQHIRRINRSNQISSFTKSLTKDPLPVPMLNLKNIKKKHQFFDNDKFHTERTLPTICKTNLRQEVQIVKLHWISPIVQRNIVRNPEQNSIETVPLFEDELEFASKILQPPSLHSESISKIVGNIPSEMISRRLKALNTSLLRSQKLYQGRKFKSKDIIGWKY